MSNIKNLLEKMDSMTSAEKKPTGPKWPGYLKGTDSAKKIRSRMVGDGGAAESVEESENFLKELDQVINENPVKRDLFHEWHQYTEGFSDTVKSTADKIVAAGSATRDALAGVIDAIPSIPRPFDEKEVAKGLSQVQSTQPKADWRKSDKKTPQDSELKEYGAAGTAVGPGNDDADPVEIAAQRQQAVGAKDQVRGQISGLVSQIVGLRNQLADLNQQFPQGANPVEKTMSLQQMTAQRNGIKSQIIDLAKQISALRQQAI
jgi:hypothetical protein